MDASEGKKDPPDSPTKSLVFASSLTTPTANHTD